MNGCCAWINGGQSAGPPLTFAYAESEGLSTNATITYATKVTRSITVVDAGESYRWEWCCELGSSVATLAAFVRFQVDGVTGNEAAEDVIGEFATHSAFRIVPLDPGVHTFTLAFRASALLLGTANIRRARVSVARVGVIP